MEEAELAGEVRGGRGGRGGAGAAHVEDVEGGGEEEGVLEGGAQGGEDGGVERVVLGSDLVSFWLREGRAGSGRTLRPTMPM